MALRAIWKFMEWAVDIIYRNSGYRVVHTYSKLKRQGDLHFKNNLTNIFY